MKIDIRRLKKSLLRLAQIGAVPRGGVSRLALSDEDKQARALLVGWMKESGLKVNVDQMGNIFGRRSSSRKDLPPLLIGSHIDTVRNGGKFDGALGVMAGLEVVRTLNDEAVSTKHPIELAAFTNEEGARFQPPMLASGVMAGIFPLEWAYSRNDVNGLIFGQELKRIGYRGSVRCRPRPLHAYLEFHIEQGPVLEAEKVPIGIVQGIVGLRWLRVTLEGESDHAGPTPMSMRRDALVAAARAVEMVRGIPRRMKGEMVTTVGFMQVQPNVVNVIPGKVTFTVDLRDRYEKRTERAIGMVKAGIKTIALQEGVKASFEEIFKSSPFLFSKEVVDTIAQVCKSFQWPYRMLMSGAGHDALYMAQRTKGGMIFVPSLKGKSHCREERSSWRDIEKGANLLLHSTLAIDAQ